MTLFRKPTFLTKIGRSRVPRADDSSLCELDREDLAYGRGSLVTAISKPSGDHLEQHFRICAVPSYQVDDLRTLLETPAVSFYD